MLKQSIRKNAAYIYVILGASLWGIIALFVDALSQSGFTALQIVTLRVTTAAVLLVAYLALFDPKALRIELKDIFSFVGTGIFSMVFFNWCYFTAIEELSLSVAVILLYTGPAFVVVLSRLFFGEELTVMKITSLLITAAGCVLVIEVFPLSVSRLTLYGVLVGLGSGFGYALYSIFGKHALRKYSSTTVITYTFVFATAALLPTSGLTIEISQLQTKEVWMNIAGLGILPTVLAYLLYTRGLSMIESSRASIAATVEPVVATLLGVFVFAEKLSYLQLLGMILVIVAVILIQAKRSEKISEAAAEIR